MNLNSISKLIFILNFLLLIGCSSVTITSENIKVCKKNKHPFLIDHSKVIVVKEGSRNIDKIEGYPDAGTGCPSHLFEEDDKFILIDCNGTIFHISKKGGKIRKQGWSWMDELPKNYVGTFERQAQKDEYKFFKKDSLAKKDVYMAKDPND